MWYSCTFAYLWLVQALTATTPVIKAVEGIEIITINFNNVPILLLLLCFVIVSPAYPDTMVDMTMFVT